MKKKYFKPKIIIKKIKLNLFFRNSRNRFGDVEGILLAGCSCTNGIAGGSCQCSA